MERERMLQQQRINESNKHASAAASTSAPRDRSPHRSVVGEHISEMRIKEEHPRSKEDQDVILMRASSVAAVADPRYHPSSLVAVQTNAAVAAAHHHANFIVAGRHGPPHGLPPQSSHLSRNIMPATLGVGGPLTHFAPPGPPTWGIDPYRDPYSSHSMMRYNTIMDAAFSFRHEAEERQKALNMYAVQSAAHLRGKEPSPIPPPSIGPLGPPPTHLRMQPPPGVSVIAPSSVPPPSQSQSQAQMPTIAIGKIPGGPTAPTIGMTVQHMIAVDPLSHPSIISKKEPDHNTMGIVVSTPGSGVTHSTISGNVIGIAPPVTPSR